MDPVTVRRLLGGAEAALLRPLPHPSASKAHLTFIRHLAVHAVIEALRPGRVCPPNLS